MLDKNTSVSLDTLYRGILASFSKISKEYKNSNYFILVSEVTSMNTSLPRIYSSRLDKYLKNVVRSAYNGSAHNGQNTQEV